MIRAIILIFVTALLGGCVILPLDYAYRDRGYGHRDHADRYYRYGYDYGEDGSRDGNDNHGRGHWYRR